MSQIWAEIGKIGAHMSQGGAPIGQLGIQMDQLWAQMSQLGSPMGKNIAPIGQIEAEVRHLKWDNLGLKWPKSVLILANLGLKKSCKILPFLTNTLCRSILGLPNHYPNLSHTFLVACTRLYKSLCWSIRRSKKEGWFWTITRDP